MPEETNKKSAIGIIMIHLDEDYSRLNMCGELAAKGYVCFGGQVSNPNESFDEKLRDVGRAVTFLRTVEGVEKIVLMGHSGGATLMSAYQAVAENGVQVFNGEDMLIPCGVNEALPAADAIMIIDSNWGNGAMTLFSVDPAVVQNGNGMELNSEYDVFAPENGFENGEAYYSEAFKEKFLLAQRERNNELIRLALERLHALEHGKGFYQDDEPFIVTGGTQFIPCNKLFPVDRHLFAHTKGEYVLLRENGSSTEIIKSVRPVMNFGNVTRWNRFGTLVTTVRNYLSEKCVLANEQYGIWEDGATGIDWSHSYDCTPANVRHIHAPVLCMGMTGSYEYLAAEEIYHNAVSEDKEILFVEGASHMFFPTDPQYGDTEKIIYDAMDRWLEKEGRLI